MGRSKYSLRAVFRRVDNGLPKKPGTTIAGGRVGIRRPIRDANPGGISHERTQMDQHVDCTLTIMEGASGKRFCPWWLHGGHLLVDGKKMSKSRGNVTTLDDLLARGFRPRHIRFFSFVRPLPRAAGPAFLHPGCLCGTAGTYAPSGPTLFRPWRRPGIRTARPVTVCGPACRFYGAHG